MSTKVRMMVAVAVVAGGLFVLLRSYMLAGPPSATATSENEISAVVAKELGSDRFSVRLKPEDVSDSFDIIHASIIEQAKEIQSVRQLGTLGVEDLASGFVERIRFMLAPDISRDYVSFKARGDPRGIEEWTADFEKYIEYTQESKEVPGMDLEGVEVRLILFDRDGEQVLGQERLAQGFGMTIGTGVKSGVLPKESRIAGMLVVEVVMPIERMDMIKRHLAPAIQGYHFAWSPKIEKWIPYESVVYSVRGSAFGAPPV